MKNLSRTLVPLVFGLAVVGISRNAHALGPVGVEAGAQVGVGTNPDSNQANPLGVGLGLRGGVTLFGGLYGGVKIMDYLGSSQDVPGGTFKYHSLQYGIDAGWGFKILLLTIRPQIGVGNINLTGTADGSALGVSASASSSTSSLYLEPGVTALISLGLLYIGADVNYMWIKDYPSGLDTKSAGALTVHGQIGVQF